MNFQLFLFWILLAFIGFCYLFFPLLLQVIVFCKKLPKKNNGALPTFSIIVPVYREAAILKDKLINTMECSMPNCKEIIFIADEVEATTLRLLNEYKPSIISILQRTRIGKMAAMKKAAALATADILVFTDANVLLTKEGLEQLISHFTDSRIGAVSGEKIANQKAEGLYWQYESYIKHLEFKAYSSIAVAGELFAIRKSIFPILPDTIILDDFMISAKLLQAGYIIAYEPNASAKEIGVTGFMHEYQRKQRIGAGAAQAIEHLGWLPYQSFWLNLQFYTRRVSRWLIIPVILPIIFILNAVILENYHLIIPWIYEAIFIAQVIFYLLAFIGRRYPDFWKITDLCAYFLIVHFGLLKGFIDYYRGKHSVLWYKPVRERL